MNKSKRYSPEVRERAVRLVFEHQGEHESQWAAMNAIASKIGCTAETLRKWVRQAERDQGLREGLTSTERDRLKVLERDNRELKRANEILRKAAAFFAQAELDRRVKGWCRSLTRIGLLTGLSRSAGKCRLPCRRTTSTRRVRPFLTGCLIERSVTGHLRPISSGFGMRTSRSMVFARSGVSLAGKALMLRVVRWSG